VDKHTDKDSFIEALLLERDELYQELSKLRQTAHYQDVIKEKDQLIKEKDQLIKKQADQLAWYRRKFWKPASERFIPQDPSQRKIDFDGIDVLPEEEEIMKQAAQEIITYKRRKPEHIKKQPVRLPLPEHLRREIEIIEPEGIDENWVRIGEEITEQMEYTPGEEIDIKPEKIRFRCIISFRINSYINGHDQQRDQKADKNKKYDDPGHFQSFKQTYIFQ
jgi:transposase